MIKTSIKKAVSLIIVAIMLLSGMQCIAFAEYTPTGDESFSIGTKFYRYAEEYGEWVETDRAARGEQVKARVFIETNYHACTGNLMFFYDKSMFYDLYERDNVLEAQLNDDPISFPERYGVQGDVIIPLDNDNYYIEDMIYEGMISEDFVNEHQCIVFGFYMGRSIECEIINGDTWFVEFDLILRDDAEMGEGDFFFEPATIITPAMPYGYCDIPVGYEGATVSDTISFFDINVTAITNSTGIKNYSTVYLDANEGSFSDLPDAHVMDNYVFVGEEFYLYSVPTPVRYGFMFSAWQYEDPEYIADQILTVMYEDITLQATWESPYYMLTYNLMDGSGYEVVEQYRPGDPVNDPPQPERVGYTFAGWATEPAGEPVAIPDTMPYDDLMFYAVWFINEYTVTFVDEGEIIDEFNVYYEAKIPEPEFPPEKQGYLFDGWECNGEIWRYLPNMPAENLVFTAVWVPCVDTPYTVEFYIMDIEGMYPDVCDYSETRYGTTGEEIRFEPPVAEGMAVDYDVSVTQALIHPDGSTVLKIYFERLKYTLIIDDGSEVVEYAVNYGEEIVMPAEPEKEGYTFAYWVDQNGDIVYFPFSMPADNVALTAVFDKNSYTATFEADGGMFIDGRETYILRYCAGEVLGEIPLPEKPGYMFVGWDRAVPNEMPADNTVFVAVWEPKIYRVTFNAEYEYIVLESRYGDEIAEPDTPDREGFVFKYWVYENTDEEVIFPFVVPADDVVLSAVWMAADYPLYIEIDGETVSETYCRFDSYVDEPDHPDREGYEFIGWYDKYEDTPVTFPFIMPTEEVVLVAKYERKSYTVTFDANGGKFLNGEGKYSVEYEYEQTVEQAQIPEKAGYIFMGWDREVPRYMPAETITLTALWKAEQYTVTFKTLGGDIIESISGDYGSEITAPEIPDGATLVCWLDEDGKKTEIPETMPSENLVFYAKLKYEFKNNAYGVEARFEDGCFAYDYSDISFRVEAVQGRREDGGVYFGQKNCSQIKLYNLKFFYGQVEIQPQTGKTVEISIPVPAGYEAWSSFVITHRHSGNLWDTFEVANRDGKIIFTTENFSEFGVYVVTDTKIKNYPKTSYAYRDSFNVDGLALEVTNADGTTSVITDTSKMNISGYNPRKIGTQTITVEYEGAVVTYEVKVAYTWWQMIIRILLLGFLWY